MKIPSLLVALLVSATVNAESTCSEESGVCICSGSCPLFTSSWGSSTLLGGSCIANKSGENNVSVEGDIPMSAGEVIMVNDIKYTYPFDACPASNGGGDAVPDDTTTVDEKDDDTTTDGEGDDKDTTDEPVTTTSGGESYVINGVKGKLQFTTDTCKYGTEVQCATASGPLCKNNMCASTTSTCDDATGGCEDLMGNTATCEEPVNKCDDGYCGVPPVYENCQCKDNQCYEMKFVPSDGSSNASTGDADVTQSQSDGDTGDDTPGNEGGDCSGCSGACISIAGEVTCCKGSIIDNRCTGDSTVTTADGVSTDYGKGENVIGGDSGVTIDDDGVNSSPIMVGSWVVGGAAIITAVVGW